MKKYVLMAAILFTGAAARSQGTAAKADTSRPVMTLKDHVCTGACKNGQHMYSHGEKGHTCTEACKKMEGMGTAALKEHVCTKQCKNGKHMYAHGEQGHTCTEKCKKKAMTGM